MLGRAGTAVRGRFGGGGGWLELGVERVASFKDISGLIAEGSADGAARPPAADGVALPMAERGEGAGGGGAEEEPARGGTENEVETEKLRNGMERGKGKALKDPVLVALKKKMG